MLSRLKRIRFPHHITTSGSVIPAELINHVRHYDELHAIAQREIAQLKAEAQVEINALKEHARAEISQSLSDDISQMRELTRRKETWLESYLVDFCESMCTEVIEHFIGGLSAELKIQSLLQAIVKQQFSKRNLTMRVHPEHVDMVDAVLAKVLADQMNITKWSVEPDDDLPYFEIHVGVANGAEVQISLQNVLALYRDEIVHCAKQTLSHIHLADFQEDAITD